MARVTVEDCLNKIPNRFKLAVLAAQRAHAIMSGSRPAIKDERKNKAPVIALREIAGDVLLPEVLEDAVITKFQRLGKMSHYVSNEASQQLGASDPAKDEKQKILEGIFGQHNLQVDD